jgi:hypothetical protein
LKTAYVKITSRKYGSQYRLGRLFFSPERGPLWKLFSISTGKYDGFILVREALENFDFENVIPK